MDNEIKDIGFMSSHLDSLTDQYESIGTQNEKTLHRSIKHYLSPDSMCHEFKIGSFIVDIYQDGKIIEIQTGSFKAMEHKLRSLLPNYSITIVYPIIRNKTIYLMNAGVAGKPKKSPKKGNPLSIGAQMTQIRTHLSHPNLHFLIFLVDVDEYRIINTENHPRKPYVRIEQFTKGFPQMIDLNTKSDYMNLLPTDLPKTFTTDVFRKIAKLNKTEAQGMIMVLKTLGIIEFTGKINRAYLYQIHE